MSKLYLVRFIVHYDGYMSEDCGGAFVTATSHEEARNIFLKHWPRVRDSDDVHADLVENYAIKSICHYGDSFIPIVHPLQFLESEYPQIAEEYKTKLGVKND